MTGYGCHLERYIMSQHDISTCILCGCNHAKSSLAVTGKLLLHMPLETTVISDMQQPCKPGVLDGRQIVVRHAQHFKPWPTSACGWGSGHCAQR